MLHVPSKLTPFQEGPCADHPIKSIEQATDAIKEAIERLCRANDYKIAAHGKGGEEYVKPISPGSNEYVVTAPQGAVLSLDVLLTMAREPIPKDSEDPNAPTLSGVHELTGWSFTDCRLFWAGFSPEYCRPWAEAMLVGKQVREWASKEGLVVDIPNPQAEEQKLLRVRRQLADLIAALEDPRGFIREDDVLSAGGPPEYVLALVPVSRVARYSGTPLVFARDTVMALRTVAAIFDRHATAGLMEKLRTDDTEGVLQKLLELLGGRAQ